MKKLQIAVLENNCIDPNKIKGWYFPNWFEKEHFELFLDRQMSNQEFEYWKEFLEEQTNIYDEISDIVSSYLNELKGDFEIWERKKKKGV